MQPENSHLMGPEKGSPDDIRYVGRPPVPLFRALGLWWSLERNRRSELDETVEGKLPDDVVADLRAGFEAAVVSGEMRVEASIDGQRANVLASTWADSEAFAKAMATDKKGRPNPVQLRINRGLHEVAPVADAPTYDDLAAFVQADNGTRNFNLAAHVDIFGDGGQIITAVPVVTDHAAEAVYWNWHATKVRAEAKLATVTVGSIEAGECHTDAGAENAAEDDGSKAPGREEAHGKLFVIADSLFEAFRNSTSEAWIKAAVDKYNLKYPKNRIDIRDARRKLKKLWLTLLNERLAPNVHPLRPERG